MPKKSVVRFGVAMESPLIERLDELAAVRGCNRSELLRDLTRAEMGRKRLEGQVPAVAAVTLVYNHHVRELSERLTALQHDLGDQVRSTMHLHLDHEHCMEIIVMRGRSDRLNAVIERMLGTRGVLHCSADVVPESILSLTSTGRRTAHAGHDHDGHEHHDHDHLHTHDKPKATRKRRTR
jgi:CopG family nickel-responsive transcriptional regulator